MNYGFTRTGPEIEAIHNTVTDPSTNDEFVDSLSELIVPNYTDLVFSDVSAMVDGKDNITYTEGMFLKVQNQNERVIEYVVTSTIADVDLGSGLWAKEVSGSKTVSERTWYVDPILGTDSIFNGTSLGSGAFKTPQFALDSLPSIITHKQLILLADGDYAESSIPGASQPRPAIIWGKGKVTTFRSFLDGSNLSGPIVIKGNSSDPSLVKIKTGSEWNYGVYNNDGQICLQDLTVETTGANGGSLITSHRNTSHIYCLNVIADSIFTTRTTSGVTCESGGQLEWIDGKVRNCGIGAFSQTSGDNMTFSTRSESIFEGNDKAILAKNNSYISLNSLQDGVGKIAIIDNTNTTAIEAVNDAQVSVRGNDGTTDMCQIEGNINIDNARVELVFSETIGAVLLENGAGIKYNASNYQRGIAAQGSDVWLSTSNSYVSPETQNTDVRPVTLTEGARINYTGVNNIVGSTGGYVSYNPGSLAYTSDNQTVATVKGRDRYAVTSNSGTKLNCQVDSSEIEIGRQISLRGTTNAVTFVDGTHMDLVESFTVGQISGNYSTAILEMGLDGKWFVSSYGPVNP